MARKTSALDREFRIQYIATKAKINQFKRAGLGNLRHVRMIEESIKDVFSDRDKRKALSDMRRFSNLQTSTVSGYKESQRRAINYWKAFGIENLSLRNYEEFMDFLEWAKSFIGSRYSAKAITEAWNEADGEAETAFQLFASMRENV